MDHHDALLPGGYWDDAGRLHRAARLRPLTGREEELLGGGGGDSSAAMVTAVLAGCVTRLGDLEPVSPDVVRRLLVADRDYLLLRLRQLTFGDRVRAELVCPWAECGERVSIEFGVSDIPVHEPPERAPQHVLRLSAAADPDQQEVVLRLPTGADQEDIAPWAARDEPRALTALLGRCVLRVDGRPPGEDRLGALSPRARAEIEAELERLAPRVERTMETTCAECGRAFTAPLDLYRFFFGELRTDRALLYREVHYLAFHYHWTESEILALSRAKRRTYIDLLAEEIERLNDGA
jgi:hypothetical protein